MGTNSIKGSENLNGHFMANGTHDFFQIFSIAFFSKNRIIPQTTFVLTFRPHIISELGGVKEKF